MLVVFLFVLGLCLGSFLNALVWRIHANKDWVRGRSQCDHCGHQLAPADLIPVVSWLALKGRCRYCKKRLSWEHPAVEFITGVIFAASYLFWPESLDQTGSLVLFITWLVVSVGLMALLVYDFKWMILPNKILYPTLLVAVVGRLVYIAGFAPDKGEDLFKWAASLAIASGIFWLLYTFSNGKWIGYGDVRLGLVTGTLLADPALSFLMIFVSSLLGTLFALPGLLNGGKKMTSKLPYGPFLIIATTFCVLFGSSLIDWYKNLFQV